MTSPATPPPPIKLVRFHAEWFSTLDWAWQETDIIAENEGQAWAFMETICKHEFRQYRRSTAVEEVDSLKIKTLYDFAVPFQLNPNV